MSGFIPYFNKRRDFLKNAMAGAAFSLLPPFKNIVFKHLENQTMVQIIKKEDQFNDVIFGGRFHANKPVFQGKSNVRPYSSLFYWSNAYAHEACEFGLHPHRGFEIMSFLLEGKISHYDTETRVWTDLQGGDFQIIQSNSGVQHQERIAEGSRAFQIWFDPNFHTALQQKPTYADYRHTDFSPITENNLQSITYIGEGSPATARTPNLTIKKLLFPSFTQTALALKADYSYTFYVLTGQGTIENAPVAQDDAVRISGATHLQIAFEGELFYIETPTQLPYKAVWQ